jgi:putative Mn2+ efflux pump MntP
VDTATVLLVAGGLSMDAFAVSVAYGLSFERREHHHALKISFAFGAFQAGMPLVGWLAGLAFRRWIEAFDHWIALVLLGLIGGKMVVDALRSEPARQRQVLSHALVTLIGLAVATSIDALAVGLALSVLHVAIAVPAAVIGATTFVLSYLGIVLGYEFTSWLRDRGARAVQLIGGLILISIGVRIAWSHLTASAAG